MLVATFNATTGWAGREITWQDERFILDGHGAITAADVMEYDRQGHLDWPSEEMRSWAAARLSWEQSVVAPAAAVPAAAQPVVTPGHDAGRDPAGHPGAARHAADGTSRQPRAERSQPAVEPAAQPADEVHDLLAPAGDIVEVVSTSSYQEALETAAGAEPDAALHVEKWAHLVPEPDNPWDRNAVAVYVDGRKVGYLPRGAHGGLRLSPGPGVDELPRPRRLPRRHRWRPPAGDRPGRRRDPGRRGPVRREARPRDPGALRGDARHEGAHGARSWQRGRRRSDGLVRSAL